MSLAELGFVPLVLRVKPIVVEALEDDEPKGFVKVSLFVELSIEHPPGDELIIVVYVNVQLESVVKVMDEGKVMTILELV